MSIPKELIRTKIVPFMEWSYTENKDDSYKYYDDDNGFRSCVSRVLCLFSTFKGERI